MQEEAAVQMMLYGCFFLQRQMAVEMCRGVLVCVCVCLRLQVVALIGT